MSAPAVAHACLDMAGTTVRDDGAVEAAFLDALGGKGLAVLLVCPAEAVRGRPFPEIPGLLGIA